MRIFTFNRTRLGGCIVTALLTLGVAGPADAVLVTGRFDPIYGGNFSGTLAGDDLYYSGTATFSIADACLYLEGAPQNTAAGGFVSNNPVSCSMSFLGASVDFYESQYNAFIGMMSFNPSASAVAGMYIQNNVVTGVQTLLIGPAMSSLGETITYDADFAIQFGVAGYDGGSIPEFTGTDPSPFQMTTLYQVTEGCSTANAVGLNTCLPSNGAYTSYAPEPGSLALALGALVAGWSVRRAHRRN